MNNIYKRIARILVEAKLSGASKALLKVRKEKAKFDRIPFKDRGVAKTDNFMRKVNPKIDRLTKVVPKKIDREITRSSYEHTKAKADQKHERMVRQDRYWKPGR
jgi:hypothetical protein